MLKRVLILGLLVCCSGVLFAQVPLEPVVDLILKEKYGAAEKELQEFTKMEKAPKNLDEVYYWLGKIQFLGENYEQAASFFQKGIEEKSKSIVNLSGLARVRIKEGNLSGADELFSRAAEIDKGKNRGHSFERAEAMLDGTSTMVGDAKKVLYQLRDAEDEDPLPHIGLATYYKKQGVRELALEEYEKAIKVKPDYVPAYVALAELKYEDGIESKSADDFNKGLEYANKAIELDAEYPSAYRIRGELYLLAKRFQKARSDMEKYVSQTQGDLNARVRFASFLYLSEEYQAAIDELKAIEAAGLKNNVMRRLMGLSLIETGDLAGAKASMDEYFANIKEEFTIFQDYKALGDIYRLQGDLTQADEAYGKMIGKNGDKFELFKDFADDYEDMAKEKITASKKLKAQAKESNAKLQQAYAARKEAYDLYQKYAKGLDGVEVDADKANAQAAIMEEQKKLMEEAEAEAKELIAQSEAVKAEAKPFYPYEAHYREKYMEYFEGESYKNFYKLALAQYNAGPDLFEKAETNFLKCHEMAPDQINPYNYRLQMARHYEDADDSSTEWLMAVPAQNFIDAYAQKDASELSKGAKRFLGACYEIVTAKAFNPGALKEPTAEDLNCEDARPLAEKLAAINPNSALAKSILDFCK